MAEPESSQRFVEVLKEIRDELRAVRIELGSRGARMPSGIRTRLVNRGGRWRGPALAAAGVAGLALVLGLALHDRPAPATSAVASQNSMTPAAKPTTPAAMPAPGPAPVILAAPVAAHVAAPATTPAKRPAGTPTPATNQAARLPAGAPAQATIASVPVATKKRATSEVAARPPSEVASDEDEPIVFPPPQRRVRVHRLSYGPVESEPAKL